MRIAWLVLFALCACNDHGKGGPMSGDAPTTGKACGGFGNATCGPTEFCDFFANHCGAADESGICTSRPGGCPDILGVPTCGCDGNVYNTACDANAAGIDINANGTCPVATGRFACGFLQCDLSTSYCKHERRTTSGTDSFTCVPFPAGCSGTTSSCACLAGESCGQLCSGTGATGLTLDCPG